MADPKIKFKRSAVAGKIPTAAQVPLGEIALNTNDGILYASKDVGAGATVIAVNPFRVGTGTDSYNTFFTAGNVGIGSTLPTAKLDVAGNVVISNGSAETSTSSTTGAVEFDGNDNLTVPSSADLQFGSGDFTIECWIYLDNSSDNPIVTKFSGNPNREFQLKVEGNNTVTLVLRSGGSNTYFTTTSTVSTSTWTHIAAVRNGNDIQIYINGTGGLSSSTFTGTLYAGTASIAIGRLTTSSSQYLNGDISNLRLVKGTAVYTSNFTPPTTQLANISGTSLLCCQSTSSVTQESTGKTITSVGNPTATSSGPGLTYTTTTTVSVPSHLNVSGITTTSTLKVGTGITASGGIVTATTFSGSGASLTSLPAANITGTLPAISGANLTNLNGSNISSGTVTAARVGALPASKITTGTFDAARIPTLNQDTTGTAALAEGLTGSPNITVSDVNVGGGLSVTGNSFFVGVVTFAAGTDGNIILGDTATDNVVFNADVNSNIVPNTNNAYDLGSSSQKWRNLFISGDANIGGTLTYEDVTNIDSVGLSTFRAGVNITGTATATLFSGSGASLTNLPAANLTGTLPAISGANLTNLDANDLASGTIPDARFPAALPAIDGSALTGITASGTGAIGGLTIKNQSGAVVGTAGSVSTIDFDGSAGVTVTATTGAAGIATVLISADLVADTSPQLGGNLDLNGNNITGSGNIPAANLTGTLPAISGANLTGIDIGIAGDSGTGTVNTSQSLTIAGTTSEIITSASGQTITLSLPTTVINNNFETTAAGRVTTGLIASQNNTDGLTLATGGGKKWLVGRANAEVELYHNNNLKLETTSSGVVVTGVCTATSFSGDGSSLTGISADVVDDTTPQLGGTLDTNGNLIQFGDSGGSTDDRLQFGASQDLQIYHDGNNSLLTNSTGVLLVRSDNFYVQNSTGTKNSARFHTGAQVDLRYNGSTKFVTTNDGAVVTGILTATSFSGNLTGGIIDSNGTTRISATTSLITLNDDTRVNGHLRVQGNQIRNSAGNANVIFSGNDTSINGDLNMGVGGASITQNNGLDVLTFTSGSNELTAEGTFNVEGLSNLKLGAVVTGVCTATSFSGDGSNLTNLPSATITGISTAGTSTFNHVSVTGVATVSTAFYLPQYTTTARDAGTFNEGAMIYNTTTKKMEFYDGTNWNTLPGVTLGLGMGVF